MCLKLVIFLLCVKICVVYCEADCSDFETCGSCIGHSFDRCAWCSAKKHEGSRCMSKIKVDESKFWCNGTAIYDPNPEMIVTADANFNAGGEKQPVVQFKPQSLKIKARPGIPVNIEMTYKPAKDYPLDVYYLIDYSYTMRTHAETLRNQGINIYNELNKLTNNVRLGVGSFVEKNTLPYANEQYSYSFKNHLTLTDDMKEFTKALYDKPNGSNNVEPKASLDGLMQAMVCKEQVGWRDNARRIIVLSTDSRYHSAGDGKFVGAARPHDMKCYVVNNTYQMELDLDYPSVSQINKVAAENNIMIIFSVDKKAEPFYKVLEKNVLGSKYIPLKADSKLVDIIKTEYLSLIRKVYLYYKIPSYMQFTLDQDCSKDNECEIKHNRSVKLTGNLTITSCPPKDVNRHHVEIGPRMLNEKLNIEVEIYCQCDCEKPGSGVQNSDMCNNAGTYQCGICNCNNNRYGSSCQCNGISTEESVEDQCKKNNQSLLCSGRGTCSCGLCDPCLSGFSGPYCEYDDKACPSPEGLLCSDHGVCKYGQCQCSPNWIGVDCKCPNNNERCKAPYSKEVCSGNGACSCGKCECNICSGKFCDDCEEVAMKRCQELEDFAYCNFIENKDECDIKYNQTNTEVTLVSKAEINSPYWYMAKYWCEKVLEDERIFVFKYYYSTSLNSKLHLIIQNELDYPPIANVWIAVGSVIGTIVFVGLLTLVAWKILVDLHDKREYNKFASESAAAGFDTSLNPLYQSPATNFTNPAYDG